MREFSVTTIYRNANPAMIAKTAPIRVLMKLITSLVSHSRFGFPWTVAPSKLSMFVAMNAAATDIGIAGAEISPMPHPYNDSNNPPSTEAAVPSAETAPSVPGSTLSKVVIKNVVLPYALPISEANVSASFVDSDATYPNKKSSDVKPQKVAPCEAQIAHASPVAADPLSIEMREK